MPENVGQRLFTDEQVMDACDISMDSLRKLITWKAAIPAQAGGGRSRVRLWRSSQIARICVASRIANAGFSLRMAHTMAYALPLDDMLSLYDLDYLDTLDKATLDDYVIKGLFGEDEVEIYTDFGFIGHVIIVNNKYVYTDALGSFPTMWGVLDWASNTLLLRRRVDTFLWGAMANTIDNHPRKVGVNEIDPSTLLVTEIPWANEASAEQKAYWDNVFDGRDPVPYMLYEANDFGFSSLSINLYVGLQVMVRRLLGLPYKLTKYKPVETPPDAGGELSYDI